MKKSLIQKISEKGKKGIVAGALVGALGLAGASLSGCAGPQIRTEPISDPYGNVKLTELGKQFQKEYGFDMYNYAGTKFKPGILLARKITIGKGMKVFYPRGTVYIDIKNMGNLFNNFDNFNFSIKGLTTHEKEITAFKHNNFRLFRSLVGKSYSGSKGKFSEGDFINGSTKIKINSTELYNSGLKQGFHTTNWKYFVEACKENICNELGSVYFSVTDKK